MLADGESWEDYNFANFTPVFFNPDLTIMFPDADLRAAAISTCNKGAARDDSPVDNRECYFDFMVSIVIVAVRTPRVIIFQFIVLSVEI